jgi:UDP-N-acetyl-D-mannosaminuronic acid dehydrogenase
LVIYGGIASLGFTEGVVKETLENASGFKVGADFGLAYNPILMPEGQSVADPVSNRELRVAANDKASLESASTVLLALTKKGIKQAIGFKTAEIAALFAVSRRDANTALSNEWAILCENAGVDYFETLKLMDCDNFGSSFVPTIGEKNRQSETYLLIESAENLNTKLRLPTLARQINENMVRHAASLTQDTLRSCGKTLRRARVAVLGVTGPNTSGSSFVKMLEAKGAKINLYDPTFAKSEMAETPTMLKRSLNEAIEGADCIIILTEQDQLKRLNLKNLRALMRTPAAIVDLVGMLEPQKVEKEGFIYRGLGRGIEKK